MAGLGTNQFATAPRHSAKTNAGHQQQQSTRARSGRSVRWPARSVSGGFSPPTFFPVGDDSDSVAIADLDGDADNDLAVSNFEGGSVSIQLNNGNATFAPHKTIPVGDFPRSVASADKAGR